MENKIYFCPIPFLTIDIAANGKLSICCDAPPSAVKVQETNPVTWFLEQDPAEARSYFLRDATPLACKACFVNEQRGLESKRQWTLGLAESGLYGNLDQIRIQPEVRFLSYRFGNLCNLACIMCNADTSTTYARVNSPQSAQPAVEYRNPLQFSDEDLRKIKDLYLGGGEPSLSEECLILLSRLIDLGHRDLRICLNTNLTQPHAKFFNLLREFSNVHLGISVDGTHDTYEKIRRPMKWDKFDRNVQYFLSEYTGFKFWFQFTLSRHNVENLPQFLRWWIETSQRSPFQKTGLDCSLLTTPEDQQLKLAPSENIQQAHHEIEQMSQSMPGSHEALELGKVLKILRAHLVSPTSPS